MPQKVGEEFILESWDFDVTTTHFGNNFFAGNHGALGDSSQKLFPDSSSPIGHSLLVQAGDTDSFGGYHTSLFARPLVDTGPQSVAAVPNADLDLSYLFH